jgi:hypothetical protein
MATIITGESHFQGVALFLPRDGIQKIQHIFSIFTLLSTIIQNQGVFCFIAFKASNKPQ